MADVGHFPLSNGVKLPRLGLGTWLAKDQEELKTALRAAFDAGYRYIDTAPVYENEAVIGEVLQEYISKGKFKREDIFLTSKLPFWGHGDPEHSLKKTLSDLKTPYVDLYLIHTPLPAKANAAKTGPERDAEAKMIPDLIPFADTWRGMEKVYRSGLAKAIGVSNFSPKQLQDVYDKAEIKPMNLQVELHILHPQNELVDLCKRLNIVVTSYGSLGSPGSVEMRNGVNGNVLEHPLVVELAKKHGKSPAQILLRQIIQRGINVIPKSTNAKRLQQNFDVFDFELSTEEMKRFDAIKERLQLFTFEFFSHHPWNPWTKKEAK